MSIKKTIEIEARVGKAEKDLEGVAKSVQKIDKNLEDVKDTSKISRIRLIWGYINYSYA